MRSDLGRHRMSKDNGRLLWFVPPWHMEQASKRLAVRVWAEVAPTCLDYCHVPGRGEAKAYAAIQPGWEFMDVRDAYASVYLPRLWPIVRRLDQRLERDIRRWFDRLGCDNCLPDGATLSHALFSTYLNDIDRRWAHTAVRYADNIATANRPQMRKELHDIGLVTTDQPTFTHRHTYGASAEEAGDA